MHDKTVQKHRARFHVFTVEAVVANLRIGHRYQLTRIGRIGQNLFIAGHAGVEYYFALAVYRRADTVPG